MTEPAIAVLPYGGRLGAGLAQKPVSDLNWPLGCPARLSGATIGDLDRNDHLIIYPKTSAHLLPRWGTQAKVSLILAEPSVIHAKHLMLLRFSARRFFRILTFNEDLIARIPNGQFFPMGTTWVPEWRDLTLNKTRMVSLIASEKRDTVGHKLRHAIVDWVRADGLDVDVMGRGYKAFDTKADGLAPYRYSVVIENVQEQNYFSEKLVDAVLCNTVPIYWGCPNLDRFMDTSGIIQCASQADVERAVKAVSEADFLDRLPKLQAIQERLESYCDIEKRAAEAIRACL